MGLLDLGFSGSVEVLGLSGGGIFLDMLGMDICLVGLGFIYLGLDGKGECEIEEIEEISLEEERSIFCGSLGFRVGLEEDRLEKGVLKIEEMGCWSEEEWEEGLSGCL